MTPESDKKSANGFGILVAKNYNIHRLVIEIRRSCLAGSRKNGIFAEKQTTQKQIRLSTYIYSKPI